MGAGQSEDDKSGWRVLKVVPNSPCDQLGLIPYFDVVTHVNGTRLNNNQAFLLSMITEGTPTKLTVLNYPQSKSREVTVVPSRGWGGHGLLGLVLRYDCYENADEDVIHVLEVHSNSPAQKAGLQPGSDYLLGTAEIAFKGYEHLDYFLDNFDNKTTNLFVFNSQTYRVREIAITPNRNWGGQGSLGCNLGIGILHRLPLQSKSQVSLETSDHSNPSGSSSSSISHSNNSKIEDRTSLESSSIPSTTSTDKNNNNSISNIKLSQNENKGIIPESEPELYLPPVSMESANTNLDNIMTKSSSPFYPGRHVPVGTSSRGNEHFTFSNNEQSRSSSSSGSSSPRYEQNNKNIDSNNNDHLGHNHSHGYNSNNNHGHSHDGDCDGHH